MKTTTALALTLILSIIFAPGCATLFKGSDNRVEVRTEPSGAKIYRNGEFYGTTPVTLNVRGNDSILLEARKTGFEDNHRELDRSIGAGWVALDLFTFWIGLVVDGLSGAWYSYPDQVTLQLEPAAATPPK